MSAPPRNARGGNLSRGRPGTPTAPRSRGSGATVARGGKGRGRGAANASMNTKAENLLQGLQSGNLNQRSGGLRRGPGRTPVRAQPNSTRTHHGNAGLSSQASTPSSQRDYLNHITAKFQRLKTKREAERAEAIRDGFLADPDKKTSLDKAITPAGTCTEMCPEFERVERIVQNMVDKTEKVPNDESGRDVPSEERMIKRFRRSAAGYDEQLPSDIRTPETLQRTLDYLLDNIVGGEERLASVHKFVWDRTRGIRNDFSIQQVTKGEDVRIAIDCFERIARFHIISLHQLSNPENHVGEPFDAHQEREQLNNTLLSLMYYYDDNRGRQRFENEAEFRAYCIIFELQSQQPDLEDRMQSWPQELLEDPRIRIAFRLYSAAGNTLYDQGPLKPQAAFDIAQGNAGGFWHLLKSKAVTYLMACVAEIYFGQVRFMALQGLWKSVKRAPAGIQGKLQDWTLAELTNLLGLDDEEQALEFCGEYGLDFRSSDAGDQYLDFTSQPEMTLDRSSTPNKQVFSFGIVEEKRYHRTLVAVINGVGVAQAIRERLVVEQREIEDDQADEDMEANDDSSLFLPETKKEDGHFDEFDSAPTFNQNAPAFAPMASAPRFLLSPATSSADINSTRVEGHTATPASYLSDGASKTPSTSTFGNDAQSKPSFGAQPLTLQARSSIFTSPAAVEAASTVSFGRPSVPPNAPPSSSTWSTAPSAVNNAWPSTAVNRALNDDKPGDDPEFVSARDLDVTPLNDPALMSLTDTNNILSTKTNSGAPSIDKPPSSPRPGFRSLPTATTQEQENPILRDDSPDIAKMPFGQQNSHSTQRAATATADLQTPNSPRGLLEAPTTRSATSSSDPADQYDSNNHMKDLSGAESSQSSPFISTSQPTKQQSSPKIASVPPIGAVKSAIPPTFTPNASPSFTSLANTKPKHKSPLGSQPPIFAADSSAKPSSPQQAAAGLNKAARNLATIGFLEPHGILQQYIEHTVTVLIEDALRQFEREEPLRAAQSLRHRLLSRKYFTRWSSICWRRKLNRNAISRREHLAQSIRQESQRKARSDAELEAILDAQKQKARIQAEQLRGSQEDPNPRVPVSEVQSGREKTGLAGHKRKSLHGDEFNLEIVRNAPRKVAKGHQRSRTVGGASTTSKDNSLDSTPVSPPQTRVNSSALSGRSVLLDGNVRSVLQRSTSGRKTDSTHTDYFRLKALGVDPDTPFVPDTKSSLERKRRRQAVLSLPTPRKRANTLSSAKAHTSAQHEASPTTGTKARRNGTAPEDSLSMSNRMQPKTTYGLQEDDDDFLQQIREVRAAMSEDTEWFRTQAAQIEKEVELGEELRSASQPSNTDSPAIAASGSNTDLARANGCGYAPLIARSGSQLSQSRTEKRIRATGAHGLATKPVSDYLPVAMSKSSSAALTSAKNPSRLKKRNGRNRQREKDSQYIYESDEWDDDEFIEREGMVTAENRERKANQKPRLTASDYRSEAHGNERQLEAERVDRAAAGHWVNAYHYQSFGLDDGFRNEMEEDEIIEQGEESYAYGSCNGIYDSDEGEDEADREEADESAGNENQSEAESTSSVYEPGGQGVQSHQANPFHMRLRSATPEARPSPGQEFALGGTQMSRATSGTGISADDALVLSD